MMKFLKGMDLCNVFVNLFFQSRTVFFKQVCVFLSRWCANQNRGFINIYSNILASTEFYRKKMKVEYVSVDQNGKKINHHEITHSLCEWPFKCLRVYPLVVWFVLHPARLNALIPKCINRFSWQVCFFSAEKN